MKLFRIKFCVQLIILIINSKISYQNSKDQSGSWCWTKPINPSDAKQIDSKFGGPNWGFCSVMLENGKFLDKVEYQITIETSNSKGMGATGQFFMKLFGDVGQSDDILLTNEGFGQGSNTVLNVLSRNVGNLQRVRVINKGNDKYKCTHIRVEVGPKFWDFDCEKEIFCPGQCYEDINLAGNQRYELSIKTSSESGAETNSEIFIQFKGIQGITPKKILTETGFEKGSIENVQIQSKDVGKVYGIKLFMKEGSWKPQKIVVKRAGREVYVFEPKGQEIRCPDKCQIDLVNPKPGAGGMEEISGIQSGSLGGSGESQGLENDYKGGGLSPQERSQMIELSCEEVVKDNEKFGPQFSNNFPNFKLIIGICPNNCLNSESKVFGKSIHPQESSICRSAITDYAMPIYGGIIGIGIVTGLEAYQSSEPEFGIQIKSYQSSEKSFFTFKIDNIDMMESDVRILNYQGLPSHIGRVEFRLDGKWGTVCSKGCTEKAARRICRDLKFADGVILNPPAELDEGDSSFCSGYKGENYCGDQQQGIHYQGLNCEGIESNILQCFRELADSKSCTHQDDLIIECKSQNFEKKQAINIGSIRIVDDSGAPAYEGTGRLEIFKNQWGSVCNSKFGKMSAEVACKTMGYDSGKLIGGKEESGSCRDVGGKDMCGNGKINIKDVDCEGSEPSLKNCGGVFNPLECGHDQDVVVDCDGQGDPSGQSQQIQSGKSSPGSLSLGKLPMIPIITASCQTNINEKIFRGDAGSIFLISCPENCANEKGTIWGTGIYTSDSSICKAAIHAGINQNYGGLITLVIQKGNDQYYSTENRGIKSTEYMSWKKSFSISKPVSMQIKLTQFFKKKAPVQKENCFLQSKSNYNLVDQRKNLVNFKKIKPKNFKHFSFLQIDSGEQKGPRAAFSWNSNAGFKFNGKDTQIRTYDLDGEAEIKTLKTFSIALKVKMSQSQNKEMTLVGHSGCGCWVLEIDERKQIVFKQRCSDSQFNSNFYMPLDQPVSIMLTYDQNTVKIYIEGELFNKEQQSFDFNCDKNLDIGSYTELKTQYFDGEITYVYIYDYSLTYEEVFWILRNAPVFPNQETLSSSKKQTTDGRPCISPCTTNPKPGQEGCPSPPGKAQLGQPDYGIGNDSNEGMTDEQSEKFQDKPSEEIKEKPQIGIEISCEQQASDTKFSGPTGKTYRVQCPKQCVKKTLVNVIGTQIYTDDSSICKAAIHAGFISSQKGGEVIMVIANGEDYYKSSNQNEIQSAAHGPNTRSIIFKEAPPLINIECQTTAADQQFSGPAQSKFAVLCEKGCSKKEQIVYGDGLYSGDSSICQSAIHAGILTDQGGNVEFQIDEGRSYYSSKQKNDIQSQKHQQFIRSFRIIGDKANTCNYFREDYNPPNIFKNWQSIDFESASKGPSDWSFNINPLTQTSLLIKQTSQISGGEYNYGSILLHKDFDCSDGLYKVNVYMKKLAFAAIIFRYSDSKNFYAFEINPKGSDFQSRIIKKVDGIGSELIGSTVPIFVENWYRFRVVFNENIIQIWNQIGNQRKITMILNSTDSSIQRGGVGVAVDHNSNTYFDGLEIKDYDKNNGIFDREVDNQMVFDQCLQSSNVAKRLAFCRQVYGTYEEGVEKCKALYNYCGICCDILVAKQENIRNYDCFKSCIFEAKENVKRQQQKAKMENEIIAKLNNFWIPKEKDKCDFKPLFLKENSYFVPCLVQKAEKINEKNYKITVKFFMNDEYKLEIIEYPNQNLTECGKSLQARTDC